MRRRCGGNLTQMRRQLLTDVAPAREPLPAPRARPSDSIERTEGSVVTDGAKGGSDRDGERNLDRG